MAHFTFARRTFVVRFWPALACVIVIAVCLSAARWQTARANYKQGLLDAYNEAQKQPALDLSDWGAETPSEFTRASVSGEWRSDALIYGDNQVRDGQAGYAVFMPLCKGVSRCVLVDRGWVLAGRVRTLLPDVQSPSGVQKVTGLVVRAQPRFVELSDDAVAGRVWQNVTVARARQATGLTLAPFILAQTGGPEDGLRRDDVKPEFGVEKHVVYVVQWYAFALVTAVSGVFAAMRKTGERT
ncbi:MAG: SURF1 family protein [Gammaproteobacteria bacterium]|jgi:surfeit locus 1 family protein|nr:SURF1 family protein [Gammaproteobacteria bacterium]MBU0770478.1 SURF1 family protein [Gammaproteobacteria bacterium]MBU0856346.1 SURF1 family protein [Gammaproteobacteria bacterium]MBU1845345.1 SURF1 family protein [Gammaproteobacteria bacterium]